MWRHFIASTVRHCVGVCVFFAVLVLSLDGDCLIAGGERRIDGDTMYKARRKSAFTLCPAGVSSRETVRAFKFRLREAIQHMCYLLGLSRRLAKPKVSPDRLGPPKINYLYLPNRTLTLINGTLLLFAVQ